MRLFGALILSVVPLWMHLNGEITAYVDVPSLVFIAGILLGGLLLSFPVSSSFRSRQKCSASRSKTQLSRLAFRKPAMLAVA
jgi:hypothetical protein